MKRKINYTKIIILLLIIWNIVLTVNIFKPVEKTQIKNIESAILDFSVAEIPLEELKEP